MLIRSFEEVFMNNARPKDVERLRECGKLLASFAQKVAEAAAPGVSTLELDRIFTNLAADAGAETPFKGYRGYPAAICTSRNNVVVHGIPSANDVLEEGDILGLDVGLRLHGMVTDMAMTVPVGSVAAEDHKLLDVTREALRRAVAFIRPGITTGDLGAHIQKFVESQGFSVIRDLVGHGVGREIHEEPAIPNFGTPGKGPKFSAGMVIAIEPMVAAGKWQIETMPDGWTVRTKDGLRAAHFEHTLYLQPHGTEILTTTGGGHPWP